MESFPSSFLLPSVMYYPVCDTALLFLCISPVGVQVSWGQGRDLCPLFTTTSLSTYSILSKRKYANIHWVNIVTILHIYKTFQNYSCLLFCKRHFRWGYITRKILALKSFPGVKEYTIYKCTPLKQIHFDKRSDYSPHGNNMQTIINIR